jgi:hypothetical protein
MAFKDRGKSTMTTEEAFITGVDKSKNEVKLDNPKETRNKQLGIKVNSYEYAQIEALAIKLDRSIAATLRYAINKVIREEL